MSLKLFKLSNDSLSKKKFVSAASLGDLLSKGAKAFGLESSNCEITTADGVAIEDEDIFQLIDNSELLVISSIQSNSVLPTSEAKTIDENQEPVENLVENGETETQSANIESELINSTASSAGASEANLVSSLTSFPLSLMIVLKLANILLTSHHVI